MEHLQNVKEVCMGGGAKEEEPKEGREEAADTSCFKGNMRKF